MHKRVLIASSSLLALPAFESLKKKPGIDVVGLLSTPNRPKGRHGTPSPNELVENLADRQVQIWKPKDATDLMGVLESVRPDLVVVIAYGRLIKNAALEKVPLGWINLHFSLLPQYRGAAPVQRAILNGDDQFGVTVFRIDEGMDTGPVLVRERVEVESQWNASEILSHLAHVGVAAVDRGIDSLLAGDQGIPQSGPSSLAPKIDKKELRLDLRGGDEKVMRQIRAFTHTPGLWFTYRGRRHILTEAKRGAVQIDQGHLANLGGRAFIGTGGLSVEVVSVIPEGRREVSGGDWVRGLHFADGEVSNDGVDL